MTLLSVTNSLLEVNKALKKLVNPIVYLPTIKATKNKTTRTIAHFHLHHLHILCDSAADFHRAILPKPQAGHRQKETRPYQPASATSERLVDRKQPCQGRVPQPLYGPMCHIYRQNGQLPAFAQQVGLSGENRRTRQNAKIPKSNQ